jgi:hypothetical protein
MKSNRIAQAGRLALLCLYMVAPGCASLRKAESDLCPPSQLAAIEAAYVSETVIACKLEGAHSRAECQAYPAIREKYQTQRAAYVECAK